MKVLKSFCVFEREAYMSMRSFLSEVKTYQKWWEHCTLADYSASRLAE